MYYGGSACDNQAMFDQNGKALPSLQVFKLIREGSEVPSREDAIADTHLMFDVGSEITLPETVNAVMNDNSQREVPVVWENTDTSLIEQGGVASYTILGTADGLRAVCHVDIVEYNFLRNYSFEDADTSMWTAMDLKATGQLYVEEKKSDALTGKHHYHFYSPDANTVEFTLEQEVTGLPEGVYRFEVSIQGGDGGATDIYSYIKINGEILQTQKSGITVYNSWDTPVIEGIEVRQGDRLTAGMYVQCEGPGAWGKIDDFKLNSKKAE